MKFTQIFVLHALFVSTAIVRANDKCLEDFDRSFDIVSDYYQIRADSCEDSEKAKINKVNAEYEAIFKSYWSNTNQNCYFLQQCNRMKQEEEALNCLIKQTWENAQRFFNMSYDATEYSIILDKKMSLIKTEKYKCTNDTVDELAVETIEMMDDLARCSVVQ